MSQNARADGGIEYTFFDGLPPVVVGPDRRVSVKSETTAEAHNATHTHTHPPPLMPHRALPNCLNQVFVDDEEMRRMMTMPFEQPTSTGGLGSEHMFSQAPGTSGGEGQVQFYGDSAGADPDQEEALPLDPSWFCDVSAEDEGPKSLHRDSHGEH